MQCPHRLVDRLPLAKRRREQGQPDRQPTAWRDSSTPFRPFGCPAAAKPACGPKRTAPLKSQDGHHTGTQTRRRYHDDDGGRRRKPSGEHGCRAGWYPAAGGPQLRRAFPHRAKLTRAAAHQALDPLRKLRNQLAHHKPILARRLDEDHARILEVAGWISPAARAWIERSSRVPLPHKISTGMCLASGSRDRERRARALAGNVWGAGCR